MASDSEVPITSVHNTNNGTNNSANNGTNNTTNNATNNSTPLPEWEKLTIPATTYFYELQKKPLQHLSFARNKKVCPYCGGPYKSSENKNMQKYIARCTELFGEKAWPLCYRCWNNNTELCHTCHMSISDTPIFWSSTSSPDMADHMCLLCFENPEKRKSLVEITKTAPVQTIDNNGNVCISWSSSGVDFHNCDDDDGDDNDGDDVNSDDGNK
jgi:hypothetical protein